MELATDLIIRKNVFLHSNAAAAHDAHFTIRSGCEIQKSAKTDLWMSAKPLRSSILLTP
jgi:hypothetical protein